MTSRPAGQHRGLGKRVVGERVHGPDQPIGRVDEAVQRLDMGLRVGHGPHPHPSGGGASTHPGEASTGWSTGEQARWGGCRCRRPRLATRGRPAHHPGRPRAQPQGRVDRPPARLAHRLHGSLGLRQVLARLRHDLRRGPAPLRRVAVGLRPPVPRPDGQAGRRLHRGALAGRLDRPEVHVQEPPLDGRHDHRGLRLPPPALRPRRAPALPDLRRAHRAADAAADRRPGPLARGGSPVPGARAGDPRPQGGVRRALQAAPDAGLLARPRQRRHPPARRPAHPGQAEEAHHRGRRRPPRGEGVLQAPAHRLGRDRAGPGRRPRGLRLRRPRRQGPGPGDEVLRADGLPQRPPDRDRRPRAALVLLQLTLRRVPRVPRPRHPHGGRPRARRPQPRRHARRGRDLAVEQPARRRLLPQAAQRARRGARLRPQHAVGGPPGEGPEVDHRRPPDQGARGHHQPLRPPAGLLRRVRGRAVLHRAPAPRGRVRHQPGALRGLHARGALPGLLGQPARAGLARRDAARPRRRPQHRRGLRAADQRDRRLPARPRPDHPRAPDRRAGAQGDPGAAQLPARRRPRLPLARPPLRLAVGRRGPAHPAGDPDRRRPGRRALRPRRALDRPPPARQQAAHRDPGPAQGPRQHPDRRRARRGHHPHRRLGRRHRPRRGGARRPGRPQRHGPGAPRARRLDDGPYLSGRREIPTPPYAARAPRAVS